MWKMSWFSECNDKICKVNLRECGALMYGYDSPNAKICCLQDLCKVSNSVCG